MSDLQGRHALMGAAALALFALGAAAVLALEPPRFTLLLSTGKTVMDEPIVYPTGAPRSSRPPSSQCPRVPKPAGTRTACRSRV